MKGKVFVTGVTGQDGAYLAKLLMDKGWDVVGGFRRGSSDKTWRLRELGIESDLKLVDYSIGQGQQLSQLLAREQFDKIYHLAGESFTASSFEHPTLTLSSNIFGAVEILEAALASSRDATILLAGSSEVFGNANEQNGSNKVHELSRMLPTNPYGVSHLAINSLARIYREVYGLKVVVPILFNHESPLRGASFLTRKISLGISLLTAAKAAPIQLGNLDATRDWGCAQEYVRAMEDLVSSDTSGDFVFATGSRSSVRDVLTIASLAAGFDPVYIGQGIDEHCIDQSSGRILAQVNSKFFRSHDTFPNAGDASKLKNEIGWRPSRPLNAIVSEMVVADIERL